MTNENLEITPEQREPGLKNPLRPEQVKDLQKGWGMFCVPTEEVIQKIAEEYLPQGATIGDLEDRIAAIV
jgi:hypothetical protein